MKKPDGNVAFKVTWVYGKSGPFTSPCTQKGRDVNIREAKKVWCSDSLCPCRKAFDNGNKKDPDEVWCYDAFVFKTWEFGLGLIHRSQTRRHEKLPAKYILPGKYAFLTSRQHGVPEKDRLVIGAYRISELFDGDPNQGLMVRSEKVGRVRVSNLNRAPKYWDYHEQTSGPAWGTGLFRYLPDHEAATLYAAVQAAARS